MKIFLPLLMLFAGFSQLEICRENYTVITSKECHALALNSEYDHCCFLYVEEDKEIKQRHCVPLKKEQFEAFDEYFDYQKHLYPDADELKFDCNSQILIISLLAILLILY